MSAFAFNFGTPPFSGLPQTGGINPATPSGGPVPSSSGGISPDAPWWQQLFPFLQLGAQTYIADQAVTSPRPSTVSYLPNGQVVATGGGASVPVSSALSSTPGWVWIVLIVVLVIVLFQK